MPLPVVMVSDAHALGTIGVIRSLGAAGYAVHALSSDAKALGLRSRYLAAAAVHPPYDDPAFVSWLRHYCRSRNVEAIVPSEGFLHAIASSYDEFAALLPDANHLGVVRRCLSKVATFECLSSTPETAAHQPASAVVRSPGEIPDLELLRSITKPVYVKRDAGLALHGRASGVDRCGSAQEARARLADSLVTHEAALWQAHVPGRKVGVSLWRHLGRVEAENMVLGIHQQPHTGGMMSLRETFWHERILEDAKRKMAALEWNGAAMMEYKWDPESDDFWFIEINARYWGYLHLDLYADKPFPRLQVDAFFGRVTPNLGRPKRKVVCRHAIPGEWNYMLSRCRDRAVPLRARLATAAGFIGLFLVPGLQSDLLYPGDRALYFRQMAQVARDLVR